MIDFKINDDGSIDFQNSNIQFVDGAERVRQQLEFRLSLWRGEWFLDTGFGTPYREQVLGKGISVAGAIAAIKKEIMDVDGVSAINDFDYDYSRRERKLSIRFDAQTPYGIVSYRNS